MLPKVVAVRVPDTLTSPATSRIVPGFVVPMPILSTLTTVESASLDTRPNLLQLF